MSWKIKRCPKCKNLEISYDISNGKIICNRCGYNDKNHIEVTYKELVDEYEENIKKKTGDDE